MRYLHYGRILLAEGAPPTRFSTDGMETGLIMYFVNQRRLRPFRAGIGRNLVLAITVLFAAVLVINGVRGLL